MVKNPLDATATAPKGSTGNKEHAKGSLCEGDVEQRGGIEGVKVNFSEGYRSRGAGRSSRRRASSSLQVIFALHEAKCEPKEPPHYKGGSKGRRVNRVLYVFCAYDVMWSGVSRRLHLRPRACRFPRVPMPFCIQGGSRDISGSPSMKYKRWQCHLKPTTTFLNCLLSRSLPLHDDDVPILLPTFTGCSKGSKWLG